MVLPRDKLVGALYEEVLSCHSSSVTFHFGKDVEVLNFGESSSDPVQLSINDCVNQQNNDCDVTTTNAYTTSSNFVVAADGAGRSIAEKVAKVKKYDDDNVRIYKVRMSRGAKRQYENVNVSVRNSAERVKIERCFHRYSFPTRQRKFSCDSLRSLQTIPLKLPENSSSWNWKLNFSARSADGRFNLDALPASKDGDYCAVMLLKEEDPLAKENADPVLMREVRSNARSN